MITPTDEQVEAACRAHAPMWDGMDDEIKVYARMQMCAALTAAFSLAAPAETGGALTELVSAATEAKKFVENIYKLDAIEWGQPDPLYAGLVDRLAKAIASALPQPSAEDQQAMIIKDQKVYDWLEANADKYGLHGHFARGTGGVQKGVLLKLMQALDALPSAALPGKDMDNAGSDLHDFKTHRAAWRQALLISKTKGIVSPPDIDDKAYWQHEIDVFDAAMLALAAALVSQPQPEGEAVAWRSVETAPNDTPLIVAWKEPPYEDLYLHTQVATKSSFDRDWTSNASGEPIRKPTHWRAYMSLADAIELGKTDNEANWDTPSRLEASRIRKEARSTHPAPTLQGAGLIEAAQKIADDYAKGTGTETSWLRGARHAATEIGRAIAALSPQRGAGK